MKPFWRILRTALLVSIASTGARGDWPQANGPHGNFTVEPGQHELVADLTHARLAWTSETRDLGFGKGSVSGYLRHLAEKNTHPGSWSAPIVADGRVYVTSFHPAGNAWAENAPQLKTPKGRQRLATDGPRIRANLRINAHDLLICIDAKTGRTLWLAAESGGANLYMGKREGFGVSAAYDDGRVFSLGTTGRLFAYDAVTAERLWHTDIGPAHRDMLQKMQKAHEEKRLVSKTGWDASLTVADGVLIVPMFDHATHTGLRGVDPADGGVLWELPEISSRYATPSVVFDRETGRSNILVANRKGELRLIAPRSGRVLWTVDGLQPMYFSLSPSATTVLVNVGSKVATSKGRPKGLLAAYRFSTRGAQRAWTMPDEPDYWFENHMDSCARRRIVIDNGRVFFQCHHKDETGKRHRRLSVLSELTGERLSFSDELNGGSLMYVVGDRLLYFVDASHSDRLTMRQFGIGGGSIQPLGGTWKPPQRTTTGYEVYMETPIVDGRLYMRTQDGQVTCFDLTAQ